MKFEKENKLAGVSCSKEVFLESAVIAIGSPECDSPSSFRWETNYHRSGYQNSLKESKGGHTQTPKPTMKQQPVTAQIFLHKPLLTLYTTPAQSNSTNSPQNFIAGYQQIMNYLKHAEASQEAREDFRQVANTRENI